jgi:citrate synthase
VALSQPEAASARSSVSVTSSAPRSEPASRQTLSAQRYVPGFWHKLYPTGDPRAVALFNALPPDPFVVELCERVAEVCGRPNIDFALTVLTRWSEMPDDAPFRLFALARTCGWIAHAMEQIGEGTLIRPRAHYTGELLE